MNNPSVYVGKTMEEMAAGCNVNYTYGFRIYLLQNADDNVGRHICHDYTIRNAIFRYPILRRCKVMRAYDYYGEIILQVLEKAG